MSKQCEWSEEPDEGLWNSDCGNSFLFNDDGPIANGFKFCPYCGLALAESPAISEG